MFESTLGKRKLEEFFYHDEDQRDHDDDDNDDNLLRLSSKLPHRKTIKCNIIDVIRNKDHISIIVDKVIAVSKLRIATTHLLKFYILRQYSINPKTINIKEFINLKFIKILISVVSKFKSRNDEEAAATTTTRSGRIVTKKKDPNFINSSKINFHKVNIEIEDHLYTWMKNEVVGLGINEDDHHYFLSGIDCSAISGMDNAVNAMAKEILKSYKLNIAANYIKYVERFVNCLLHKQKSKRSMTRIILAMKRKKKRKIS